MKKSVKLDVRDWWELMNGIISWAILYETMAQNANTDVDGTLKASSKKVSEAIRVGRNYRRIVGEIEKQIGETGYHPGLSEHLSLLR